MKKPEFKFDWNDITIVPAPLSDISSRKEVNPYLTDNTLPLFTAPMDMVVDENNANIFIENKINVCLPRNIKYNSTDLENSGSTNPNYFYSYALDEIIEILQNNKTLPPKVLIDTANGSMIKLYNISKKIKEIYHDRIQLIVGNIANPETYRKYCEIGVDMCRCGIGAGSMCTTSANVSIHYPLASLISECYETSKEFEKPCKIIADGGFKNYSDIIKALALGADFIMLGSIFNKALESCGETYFLSRNEKLYQISIEDAINRYNNGQDVYKYYRGMSTKEVQRDWNKEKITTSEGISGYNKVEYTLSSWCENFTDYLKSAMSYTNSKTLDDFIGKAEWVHITQNAFNRFNK